MTMKALPSPRETLETVIVFADLARRLLTLTGARLCLSLSARAKLTVVDTGAQFSRKLGRLEKALANALVIVTTMAEIVSSRMETNVTLMTVLTTAMKRVGPGRTASARAGKGSSTSTATPRARPGPGTPAGAPSTAPAQTSPTKSKPRAGAGEAASRWVKKERNAVVQGRVETGANGFTKAKTAVLVTRTSGRGPLSTK